MFCPEVIAAQAQFQADGARNGVGDGDVEMPTAEDGIGVCEHPALKHGNAGGPEVPIKAEESSGLDSLERGASGGVRAVGEVEKRGFVVKSKAVVVGQTRTQSRLKPGRKPRGGIAKSGERIGDFRCHPGEGVEDSPWEVHVAVAAAEGPLHGEVGEGVSERFGGVDGV